MSELEQDVALDIEGAETEDDELMIQYDIASYPSDYTLSVLKEMWDYKSIIIPDYQREFVWTLRQSSLLIDSFLSGLPVPPMFFYIDKDNKNLVIDGQQRLMSVIFFFDGYFGREDTHGNRKTFRLNLGSKHPYDGKSFSDLDDAAQRKLKQSVLRAVNIRQLNPDDGTSAYHVFERLNTGGTALTAQEIRNCVFRGELNTALKELNKNEDWRKVIGKTLIDKHQKDVELLLRVFAFTQANEVYEQPLKEYLNKAMKKNQNTLGDEAKQFIARMPAILSKIVKDIGEKPFHLRGPINVSALDSVLSMMVNNFDAVMELSDLKQKYDVLKQDGDFMEATRQNTTDPHNVSVRTNQVKTILLG